MPRLATFAVLASLTAAAAGCDEAEGWSLNIDVDGAKGKNKNKDKDQPVDLAAMSTAAECGFQVGQAHPFNGDEDIFLADNLSFDLAWVTERSEDLVLELVEVDTGEVVDTYNDDQGYYLYVVPYEPLKADTRFLLQATTADGCTAKMSTFTTGVWGRQHPPATHTAFVMGQSMWGDTNWDAITKAQFWKGGLLSVWQGEEGQWAFGAWFEGQDTCTETVWADGEFHRGQLSLRSDEVVLRSLDRPIPLYDLSVHALVAEGGHELERVDIDALADLWWVGQDEGLSCNQVLRTYGSAYECTTCPDGSDWCAYVDTFFDGIEAGGVDASDWARVDATCEG